MRPRWHLGWILFAIVMVWAECMGDVPRILLPQRTTAEHLFISYANVTAVTGLTCYAFRFSVFPNFWRIFAPAYALIIAAQFGKWLPAFSRVMSFMFQRASSTPLSIVGALALTVPILAMTMYTIVALLRLGDWIGPTRRPVGLRPTQLSLPI